MTSRTAAATLLAERCPRCSSIRVAQQSFCLECALPLPSVTGREARARRRWIRRIGWYPGDWVILGLPALLVATLATVVAITVIEGRRGALTRGSETVVAASPKRLPTAPTTVVPNRRFTWPEAIDGWTVVLLSTPVARGRARPVSVALRAARDGLPQVGVLSSSDFPSLQPGYFVVFGGIYLARSDAVTALQTVQARGFDGAYVRQVSH